ncbi:MAG TPA: hypothetical protein VKY19_07410 [Ktedonosporobacter sp.]|nr:hypothetical protein [Ktedonosporobacter sp.]
MESKVPRLNRRQILKVGSAGLVSVSTLGMLEALAWQPVRVARAAPLANLPEIQFDLGAFIAPAKTLNDGGGDVLVQFGPVFTLFLTMQLTRFPSLTDFQTWHDALERIESVYPFSPSGVFTIVSYGLPYFNRLPSSLVSANMPRLLSNNTRFALEEAVPSPTDVSPGNPGITKQTFNVPVKIENNDVLVTLRSDSLSNLNDVVAWLQGSNSLNGFALPSPAFNGLFKFTSTRVQFTQIGMPRKVANSNNLPFAGRINPDSPMWMGFLDQQVNGSGPASICTFQGNSSAVFTNASSSSYFANGSIQHLSHVIEDLPQFYADDEPYTERVQYMFRSDPIPSTGNADQFTNGGGPSYFTNLNLGTQDAANNAAAINTFQGQNRMGHLSALQISSRAKDGTPVHIRMDGPGFDNMDVPDGSNQAKLQFTVFVPTADFFATMRKNQGALSFQQPTGPVAPEDNGLERFLTATRRQNFLVPPRSRRAFPLREFLS